MLTGYKLWIKQQRRIWRQKEAWQDLCHASRACTNIVLISGTSVKCSQHPHLMHKMPAVRIVLTSPKNAEQALEWGDTFGLTSPLSLLLSTANPQGIAVCLHISKLTQFSGRLRRFGSTKVVKLLYFTVFGCTSESPPSGHIRAMGKTAVYFCGVMAYVTQLSSLFSIFEHAKVAYVPESSRGVWAICATGNLLCQCQLCVNSKPSQSMSSPWRRKKKVTSIVVCQLP